MTAHYMSKDSLEISRFPDVGGDQRSLVEHLLYMQKIPDAILEACI